MVATDSRWSQRLGRWLVYVDDTGFHKIEVTSTAVFMFAGLGLRIEEWKRWLRSSPAPSAATMPGFEGICICAVDRKTGEVKICEKMPIIRQEASFGGSGARFAYSCWDINKDACRSVDTAKGFDPATGGSTMHYSLTSGATNLSANSHVFSAQTISDVDKELLSRGIVMDISQTSNPVPFAFSQLAANNEEVKELQTKIASGELSAEAPSSEMHSEWTDHEKSRVTKALGEMFGWN